MVIDKRLIAAWAAGIMISMAILVAGAILLKRTAPLASIRRAEASQPASRSPGEASVVELLRSIYSDGTKDRQEQAKLEEAAGQFSVESKWLSQKEEEIKANADKMLASLKKGLSYAAGEDYKQAEKEFRYCVEIYPESTSAWSNLAATSMKVGRMEEAKYACDKAITLDPHSWVAHYNLGSLYAMRGERDNAIRELSEALRLVSEGKSPQMTKAEMSEHIKGDRSFESLQKDRRFHELLARN
jgi:Flp pilus assembly protein TadD